MPSPPVRSPNMTDEEWQTFVDEYRIVVLVPLEMHLRERAKLANIGLILLIPIAIIVAMVWLRL
ncbi:MAG: hypothetical protein WC919_03315 [Candidatus Paceibacterota bacterium]